MYVGVVNVFIGYVFYVYGGVILMYVYVDFQEYGDDVGVLVDWMVVFGVYL